MDYSTVLDWILYDEDADQHIRNSRNIKTITFSISPDNAIETLKWCRKHLGNRHDGWDFSGGPRNLKLYIFNDKLLTIYSLWRN